MPEGKVFLLKALNQEHEGKIFEISDRLLIGRSRKCDVLLEDGLVSRCHALFEVQGEHLVLTDLSSRNGSYVNQERIQSYNVEFKDLIRIGRSEFTLVNRDHLSPTLFELIDDPKGFAEPIIKKPLLLEPQRITDSFLKDPRRTDDFSKTRTDQREPQWFEVLFHINCEIQTQTDAVSMSEAVSDMLLTVLDGDRCIVALLNENKELDLHTVRGSSKDEMSGPVKVSKTIVQQVLEERCALNVNDISQDQRFVESDSLLLSEISSLLVAPIMIGNRVLGLLEVSRQNTIDAFSEAGLELLSIVGSMLGAALNHFEQIRKQEAYIQELQAAHEQLRLAQADLVKTQQLAVIGRMASSINHEIGNLLMPILEFHTNPEEVSNPALSLFSPDELAYSCTQIKSLVEDIKYFSKGTNREPEMSRCELGVQVEKAVRFVQIDRSLFPAVGINRLEIKVEINARPKVIIDPLQIGRVIINLLRNAAQAMRGQSRPPELYVKVNADSSLAKIEVSDNGPGIPEEIKTKLFEPFITTKGEQGLGLGLDISRSIVQAHGGHIEFESHADKGTVFKISLPLNPTIKEERKGNTELPPSPTMSSDSLQ